MKQNFRHSFYAFEQNLTSFICKFKFTFFLIINLVNNHCKEKNLCQPYRENCSKFTRCTHRKAKIEIYGTKTQKSFCLLF